MSNESASVVSGVGGSAAIVVGQSSEGAPVLVEKVSILSIDILQGLYPYALTIGDAITFIGFTCTIIAVYLAVTRARRQTRRNED